MMRRTAPPALFLIVAAALAGRVILACATSDEVLGNEVPDPDASSDSSTALPPSPTDNDAGTDAGLDGDSAAPTCTAEGWCYTALPAGDSYDASALPPNVNGISYPMRSVWVAPDNRAWAVTELGHLLRFDEATATWKVVVVIGDASFRTIWGTSATDLWIGGDRGVIYRATVTGDEVAFARITIGTTQTIGRILGTGPNNVWAIADGQSNSGTLNRVWRFTNGPGFVQLAVPSSFTHSSSRIRVQAVWLKDQTLWVSGYETTSCGPIACKFQNQLVAAKWNGPQQDGGTPAWQHVPLIREYTEPVADAISSTDGVALLAVRGPGDEARTVRITDDNAKLDAGASDPWFDGGVSGIHDEGQFAWTSELAHTFGSPNGVYASSQNDVWLVGRSGTIRHFDGKEWKLVPLSLSRVTPLLLDLHSISVRGEDMWVVGDDVALRRKVKP